jgi:hypothetical protein
MGALTYVDQNITYADRDGQMIMHVTSNGAVQSFIMPPKTLVAGMNNCQRAYAAFLRKAGAPPAEVVKLPKRGRNAS